jgi:hypothetical protein
MSWTPVTAITPSNKWRFTAAIDGEFFRLKHSNAPHSPKAWICQAEKLDDNTYQIFDVQPIRGDSTEVFRFIKPAEFSNRCLGFRYAINYQSNWTIDLEKFTTTTSTPSDPDFDKVIFLSHYDGVNNSKDFVDVKGHSIIPNGDVIISTAQSKFNGSSAYFPGNSLSYLSIAPSPDFNINTGQDFTIEFFTSFISLPYQKFQIWTDIGGYDKGVRIGYHRYPGSTGISLLIANNNLSLPLAEDFFTIGNFYFIQLKRSQNGVILLINDIQIGEPQSCNASIDCSSGIVIGNSVTDKNQWFAGYVDEQRISKVARSSGVPNTSFLDK